MLSINDLYKIPNVQKFTYWCFNKTQKHIILKLYSEHQSYEYADHIAFHHWIYEAKSSFIINDKQLPTD